MARDTLVDCISDQAEKYGGHKVASKIRLLRSDAQFKSEFEKALQKAIKRFSIEYESQDEDLSTAIMSERTILEDKQVTSALITMLKQPGSYLDEEREILVQSFNSVLPQRKTENV